MMKTLVHRGPDGEGMFFSRQGCFGHCRLSIMDPEGGRQPIYNEDHAKAVIANGEIYNFRDLRKQMADRHHWRTASDSEVILHLFEERGPEAAAMLDGMFAFAIADGDEFFVARDPIGIKPL